MIVYKKFGYELKLLEKEDGKEVFQYLASYKLKNKISTEERSVKREDLKALIRNEIDKDNHTPIGLYKDNILIGVCFTEIYGPNKDVAKISYIKVDKEYHKNIGPHVLFNFLINILYQEIQITFNNNTLNMFGKIARVYPAIMNVSGFREDFSIRLDKYFKEN